MVPIVACERKLMPKSKVGAAARDGTDAATAGVYTMIPLSFALVEPLA